MAADARRPPEAATYGPDRWPARAAVRGPAPLGGGAPGVGGRCGGGARTALQNQLSPRRLFERVVAAVVGDADGPGPSTADLAALSRAVLGRPTAAVNGGWGLARVWSELLESATRQRRLDELTTMAWADRLSTRDLLRDLRAFCPVCLEDWRRAGRPAYEPLRWQFQALGLCVTHGVRLRTTCPTPGCGRERGVTAGWASIERCLGCRLPLARPVGELGESETSITPEELDWARFVDAELGDILAHPPAAGELGRYRFPDVLALAVESVAAGSQRAFAARIGMTEATVSYWKDDCRRPSLLGLLRVCRAAGFRLRDVLLGDLAALEATPAPLDAPTVPPAERGPAHIDHGRVRRELELARTAEPPASLAAVLRRIEVDRSHVRRRYPALCARIRDRYADHVAAQVEARRAERRRLLLEAIHGLDGRDVYPSRNQLYKVLPVGFMLLEPDLSSLWRETLIDLGWPDPSSLRRIKGVERPEPVRRVRAKTQ